MYDIMFQIAEQLLPYQVYLFFTLAVLITVMVFTVRNLIYIGKIRKMLLIYIAKGSKEMR